MDLKGKIPEVFNGDVTSVSDYKERISAIQEFCSENPTIPFHFYYRGDEFTSKTQCNLFRRGTIANEAQYFANWKKEHPEICEQYCDEFTQLAYMQHYQNDPKTRLLDFTENPLIALRFACGRENDNSRRKVTIYNTDCIEVNNENRTGILQRYLRLVKSNEPLDDADDEYWAKDIFVKMEKNFPRIAKQEGLFLLMGNFTTEDLLNPISDPPKYREKVCHELSATIGRGALYKGYVGVLSISAAHVHQIRNELEKTLEYSIKYLMGKNI